MYNMFTKSFFFIFFEVKIRSKIKIKKGARAFVPCCASSYKIEGEACYKKSSNSNTLPKPSLPKPPNRPQTHF